jgi:hypothetical protein
VLPPHQPIRLPPPPVSRFRRRVGWIALTVAILCALAAWSPVWVPALPTWTRGAWPTATEPTYGVRVRRCAGLVSQGKFAVPELSQHLQDPVPWVQQEAARSLGLIGPDAVDAVEELIRALTNSEGPVRAEAAWALGQIGPPAGAAEQALEKALKDPVFEVRRNAEAARGLIGVKK